MKPTTGIPYKIFWTWDHSTNWCLNVPGSQNAGVANGYAKEGIYFEKDYCRAIDWCAENGINAIGIVGMLRDRHGGVDAARRVCDYGRKKGVLIYVIAGLYAYSGIYYEGNHKYNLNKFFEKNPHLIGKRANGDPLIVKYNGIHGYKHEPQGCPSSPELNEYVLESLDWLFKEIPELGGIQMEAGDSGVCQCPKCVERRGFVKENMSVADMAGIYPKAADVVWSRSPDAWVICETYHHFNDEACSYFRSPEPSEDLKRLYAMPEKTFWQWKCDKYINEGGWDLGDQLPEPMKKFRHVMRAHSGTQWRGGRHTLAVDLIRKQCLLSDDAGFECVSMFGEQAPFHANADFNYRALIYFAERPSASVEDYAADIMAPMLGSKALAERYIELNELTKTPEKIPAASAEIARIAAGLTDYAQCRRWQYLANHLNSYEWEASSAHYGIAAKREYADFFTD